METEKRFVEFRTDADGVITGTVVRYGDRAKIGNYSESFAAGSLRADDVIVNLQHDRNAPVARTGAGLELRNGSDALEATINLPDTPPARAARELVNAGILRGMSMEFIAKRDAWQGEHRTVQEAELVGIALVDRPAYPESVLAERMKELKPLAAPKRRLAL